MLNTKFKVFCIVCEWNEEIPSDKVLYGVYSVCPECKGCTDAIRVY